MNHNSVALIVTACDGLYRHVGFVASMVAKYVLLCGRWSFLLVARYGTYLATNRY